MSAFVPLGSGVVSGIVSRNFDDMCRGCRDATFIVSIDVSRRCFQIIVSFKDEYLSTARPARFRADVGVDG